MILVGEARLERFQKRLRGRLKAWKEEEHRADKALENSAGLDKGKKVFRREKRDRF